ncbi:ATP-dependent RNA helicase [Penicillium hetheringtonii]|uniref:ATP-dependent RNA helicase n=1 Tax=Penicillium hetheringtonii TaxID=911720 RepID=A0AAD6GY60_9EURO|nr:ATP-dependent RNA helicase [Penicillium hetheringtonii]
MFGAMRRFGTVHALRAAVPRSSSVRWTPQLFKWQPPSIRSLTFPALREAVAAVEADIKESAQQELITEFADLQTSGLISPSLIRNITHPNRMGLKTMTDVQSQTINQMLQGDDVLAQAKTGTGKTLAFLIPTMQNIINDPTFTPARLGRGRGPHGANPTDIRALIISPTRELAEQIAAEAMKVAANSGLVVQTAVGGTQKTAGLRKMQREGCHLLVGTPGRLKDILSDPRSGVAAPKLNTLILDEADRLLDDGFSEEIRDIQSLLPDPYKVDRQTLMLSATVPREVMRMVDRTMKPDYKPFGEDEAPTHLRVPQRAILMPGYENALPAVLDIIKEYKNRQSQDATLRPFKAIIYGNATNEVSLAAQVFEELQTSPDNRRHPLGRMELIEIHSKLSQAQRTNAANGFRRATEALLFSSDVTARGMDFPEVTHVIQIGLPRDRETYIHRLGRTARANKTGEGWILFGVAELSLFRRQMSGIPIDKDDSIPTGGQDLTQGLVGEPDSSVAQVMSAMSRLQPSTREYAWKSQFGTLSRTHQNKRDFVEIMNRLAVHGYALPEPPAISARLAQNLGLSRIGQLRVEGGRSGDMGMDRRSDFRSDRGFDRRSGGFRRSRDYDSRSRGFDSRPRRRSSFRDMDFNL